MPRLRSLGGRFGQGDAHILRSTVWGGIGICECDIIGPLGNARRFQGRGQGLPYLAEADQGYAFIPHAGTMTSPRINRRAVRKSAERLMVSVGPAPSTAISTEKKPVGCSMAKVRDPVTTP